jgi:hypothetical protein
LALNLHDKAFLDCLTLNLKHCNASKSRELHIQRHSVTFKNAWTWGLENLHTCTIQLWQHSPSLCKAKYWLYYLLASMDLRNTECNYIF